MTGHITLYSKEHDVLCWRAFYTKEGCKKVMEIWERQYGEQASYFQIYIRPFNEKRNTIAYRKENIIRPKSVYNNLPIYNYDK